MEGVSELCGFCDDPMGPTVDPAKAAHATKKKEEYLDEEFHERLLRQEKEQLLVETEEEKKPPPLHIHGRPHLKVMPSLLATGDLGIGLNSSDYYKPNEVCEACCLKYESIDAFREKVHKILMHDLQREADRKQQDEEAQLRSSKNAKAMHCVLNVWCVLGIGHAGSCSKQKITIRELMGRSGSSVADRGRFREKAQAFIKHQDNKSKFGSGAGILSPGIRRLQASTRHANMVSTGGIKAAHGWYGDENHGDQGVKDKKIKSKKKRLGEDYGHVKKRVYDKRKVYGWVEPDEEAWQYEVNGQHVPYKLSRPRSAHMDSKYQGRINTAYEDIPTAPVGTPRIAAALPGYQSTNAARPLTSLGLRGQRETTSGVVRRMELRESVIEALKKAKKGIWTKHSIKGGIVNQGALTNMIEKYDSLTEDRKLSSDYNEVPVTASPSLAYFGGNDRVF